MSYTLHLGSVQEVVDTLPPNSVQCIVTSPPYWALRDYKLKPTVWGGDTECAHDWGAPTDFVRRSNDGPGSKQATNIGSVGRDEPAEYSFCIKCGAWLGQFGLEPTAELFVDHMVWLFRKIRRVLRPDGTLWLNMGDTYATGTKAAHMAGNRGSSQHTQDAQNAVPRNGNPFNTKPKDLVMIPARVALALQADGWWVRSDIIWEKPNPMPESTRDRPCKSHEYVFLLTKSARYFYDDVAIREPINSATRGGRTRNGKVPAGWVTGPDHEGADRRALEGRYTSGNKERKFRGDHGGVPGSRSHQGIGIPWENIDSMRSKRSVWRIPTAPFPGAHFATFPAKLVEPCVLAGTSPQACESCGAPWKRTTIDTSIDRTDLPTDHPEYRPRVYGGKGAAGNGQYAMREARGKFRSSETTGWGRTCLCAVNTGSGRCVVMDPFAGAGTTLLVADRLGRHGLGIELNPEYAAMARARIDSEAPLFAEAEE